MARPFRTVTHTCAQLEVSRRTYDEISELLRDAGYDEAFMQDGTIDMHGIGLIPMKPPRVKDSYPEPSQPV